MKKYLAYIPLETGRFLRPRNLVIMAVLLALLLVVVNPGINKYKDFDEKVAKFKQLQEKKFNALQDYKAYSILGIVLQFIPAPISVLFDNTIIPPDLNAKFNTLTELEINPNMKGKILARGFFIGPVNIGFILLIILSLLILFFGKETFHNREYQKFLFAFRLNWQEILTICFTRFFLFMAAVSVINGLVLLFIKTRGVDFTAADYKGILVFLPVIAVVFLFYFTIGLVTSAVNSAKLSLTLLFGSWILLTILVPAFFQARIEDKFPDAIRDLESALNKLEIQLKFEEYAVEKLGKFKRDNIEANRIIIEEYMKDYFPKIFSKEKELIEILEKSVTGMQRLFALTPATFYLMTWSEVSSTGYASFFEYYRWVLEMMGKFTRFWIDRVFYHDVHQLVNFIKANEDLFVSQSRRPQFYWLGIGLHLGIALLLSVLFYFMFMRNLFPRTKIAKIFEDIVYDFKKNKNYTAICHYPECLVQFANELLGKAKGLKWKFTLNGKQFDQVLRKCTRYLPDPRFLPEEIKGRYLLNFIKRLYNVPREEIDRVVAVLGDKLLNSRFKKLSIEEKIRVLVMIMSLSRGTVYLLFNILGSTVAKDLPKTVDDESTVDSNAGGENEEYEFLYIQETLQGKEVVIIDISMRRQAIVTDEVISFMYNKKKFYLKK